MSYLNIEYYHRVRSSKTAALKKKVVKKMYLPTSCILIFNAQRPTVVYFWGYRVSKRFMDFEYRMPNRAALVRGYLL